MNIINNFIHMYTISYELFANIGDWNDVELYDDHYIVIVCM